MKSEIFFQKHKEIVDKYNVIYEPDGDYPPMMNGCNYYDNKDEINDNIFITHITGISIDDDGVSGDVDGYLNLLSQSLMEYREDPVSFKNN